MYIGPNVHLLFRHTGNGCVQHVWFAQNGALIVRLTREMHKRAIIARIIYAPEKTLYGLKKTISWKDYSRLKKDYLRLEVISAE